MEQLRAHRRSFSAVEIWESEGGRVLEEPTAGGGPMMEEMCTFEIRGAVPGMIRDGAVRYGSDGELCLQESGGP